MATDSCRLSTAARAGGGDTLQSSGVAGAGAGLFTVRGVGAGQLISFYSGLVNLCAAAEASIKLDRRLAVTLADTNRRGPVCISSMHNCT